MRLITGVRPIIYAFNLFLYQFGFVGDSMLSLIFCSSLTDITTRIETDITSMILHHNNVKISVFAFYGGTFYIRYANIIPVE